MHVAQIAVAVTRDLITKYHYFHTSFQIWPDQIKVRARGNENCTLSRVIHSGWIERGWKLASLGCPQGHCREKSWQRHGWRGRFPGFSASAKWSLWAVGGPPGHERDPHREGSGFREYRTLPFIIGGFKQ